MTTTPKNPLALSPVLMHDAARAVDRLKKASEWSERVALADPIVSLSWDDGSGLSGYEELRVKVAVKVGKALPHLIEEALEELSNDAVNALQAVGLDE